MRFYRIAGIDVRDEGIGLSKLDGFREFETVAAVSHSPIVLLPTMLSVDMLHRMKPADTTQDELLYSFDYFGADVAFGKWDGGYWFRIGGDGRDSSDSIVLSNNIGGCDGGGCIDSIALSNNIGRSKFVSYGDNLKFALWVGFGVSAAYRKTVSIHSSVVVYKGQAIMFLGESGTGKSTHTALWMKYFDDTTLLNDDSPFIKIEDDGSVMAYGSPWSGKTPCYRPEAYPVAAIVRLRQAPYNKLRRMSNLEAIGALLPSCPLQFAYDKTLSELIQGIISDVIINTPVFFLDCLPNRDAAETAKRVIND